MGIFLTVDKMAIFYVIKKILSNLVSTVKQFYKIIFEASKILQLPVLKGQFWDTTNDKGTCIKHHQLEQLLFILPIGAYFITGFMVDCMRDFPH